MPRQFAVEGACGSLWIIQAVFHSLCCPDFLQHPSLEHGVILTGKGYPDLSTRELVKRLSLDIPRYVPPSS
jgi:meiotic recombination protein SPO11